jgi:hypothetical protein
MSDFPDAQAFGKAAIAIYESGGVVAVRAVLPKTVNTL